MRENESERECVCVSERGKEWVKEREREGEREREHEMSTRTVTEVVYRQMHFIAFPFCWKKLMRRIASDLYNFLNEFQFMDVLVFAKFDEDFMVVVNYRVSR